MIERLERGRTFQCGWVLTDDAGEAIDADSTPTVARIFKNRVATVEAATVTDQTASETGCYALTFSPNAPVAGDFYEIVIESTISSSIKPTKIQFVVTEKVGELISILGTALTESSTGRIAGNLAALFNNDDNPSTLGLDQISTLTALQVLLYDAGMLDDIDTFGGRLMTQITENAGARLEKLNVAGTLANTDNADTFKADVSGIGGDATLANQELILAKLALRSAAMNDDLDQSELNLIQFDTYDGVANEKKSWATEKDYTSADWSIKLLITDPECKTVLISEDGEAESNVLVSIPALTADFNDYELEFLGCPSTAKLAFAVVAIHNESGEETIAYGVCNVRNRGAVV